MTVLDGEVHASSLVVNPAGCIEDIFRTGKIDHVVMFLWQPDGRSIEEGWGAPVSAKEFTLETEGHIAHPRFLPGRVIGKGVQGKPGEASCALRGGPGSGSSPECGPGVLKCSFWPHNI